MDPFHFWKNPSHLQDWTLWKYAGDNERLHWLGLDLVSRRYSLRLFWEKSKWIFNRNETRIGHFSNINQSFIFKVWNSVRRRNTLTWWGWSTNWWWCWTTWITPEVWFTHEGSRIDCVLPRFLWKKCFVPSNKVGRTEISFVQHFQSLCLHNITDPLTNCIWICSSTLISLQIALVKT